MPTCVVLEKMRPCAGTGERSAGNGGHRPGCQKPRLTGQARIPGTPGSRREHAHLQKHRPFHVRAP
jgi:hypothetical protein